MALVAGFLRLRSAPVVGVRAAVCSGVRRLAPLVGSGRRRSMLVGGGGRSCLALATPGDACARGAQAAALTVCLSKPSKAQAGGAPLTLHAPWKHLNWLRPQHLEHLAEMEGIEEHRYAKHALGPTLGHLIGRDALASRCTLVFSQWLEFD